MSSEGEGQSRLGTALECVQNYPYVWLSAVVVVMVIMLVMWYRPLEKFGGKKTPKSKKSSDTSDDDEDLSSTMEETIANINQKQEANKRKK